MPNNLTAFYQRKRLGFRVAIVLLLGSLCLSSLPACSLARGAGEEKQNDVIAQRLTQLIQERSAAGGIRIADTVGAPDAVATLSAYSLLDELDVEPAIPFGTATDFLSNEVPKALAEEDLIVSTLLSLSESELGLRVLKYASSSDASTSRSLRKNLVPKGHMQQVPLQRLAASLAVSSITGDEAAEATLCSEARVAMDRADFERAGVILSHQLRNVASCQLDGRQRVPDIQATQLSFHALYGILAAVPDADALLDVARSRLKEAEAGPNPPPFSETLWIASLSKLVRVPVPRLRSWAADKAQMTLLTWGAAGDSTELYGFDAVALDRVAKQWLSAPGYTNNLIQEAQIGPLEASNALVEAAGVGQLSSLAQQMDPGTLFRAAERPGITGAVWAETGSCELPRARASEWSQSLNNLSADTALPPFTRVGLVLDAESMAHCTDLPPDTIERARKTSLRSAHSALDAALAHEVRVGDMYELWGATETICIVTRDVDTIPTGEVQARATEYFRNLSSDGFPRLYSVREMYGGQRSLDLTNHGCNTKGAWWRTS